MEKIPFRESAVHRIVGGTEREREVIREERNADFAEDKTGTNRPEMEKGKRLKELIDEVSQKLGKFLRDYGLEQPITIRPDQIEMWDVDQYCRERGISSENFWLGGLYDHFEQRITADPQAWKKEKYNFVHVLAHEMVHMQSFQSVQAVAEHGGTRIPDTESDGIVRYRTRRLGLSLTEKQPFVPESEEMPAAFLVSFKALNEAVTEELTRRFLEAHAESIPLVKREMRLKAVQARARKAFAALGLSEPAAAKPADDGYLYSGERKVLNELIDQIYAAHPDTYTDREEVFKLFSRAALNGNLLPLGKEVERTFGKGALRKLADTPFSEKECGW